MNDKRNVLLFYLLHRQTCIQLQITAVARCLFFEYLDFSGERGGWGGGGEVDIVVLSTSWNTHKLFFKIGKGHY